MNSDYIEYKGKKTKRLNISIGPRVYISTLEVTGSRERDFADFGSVTHFTFDIEVEAFYPSTTINGAFYLELLLKDFLIPLRMNSEPYLLTILLSMFRLD